MITKVRFLKSRWRFAAILFLLLQQSGWTEAPRSDSQGGSGSPFAISTFHCLGLYWSPPGGAADKEVKVRYRPQGASAWKEALSLRYNPIPNTDKVLADYRGSIVHLRPGTTYEVQLTLAGTSTATHLTATTWRESFPVGQTIRVSDRGGALTITESGTPRGYRVYDGRGATIDVSQSCALPIGGSGGVTLSVVEGDLVVDHGLTLTLDVGGTVTSAADPADLGGYAVYDFDGAL